MTVSIVVVGSLNMDLTVQTERIPRPGESIIGSGVSRSPGGKGGNQAVAAARLGGQVLMVGRVGRDENGERMVRGLVEDGVDTAFIYKDAQASTGLALITVDRTGQNTIVISPGANWNLTPKDVSEAADLIRKADAVLLQLEIPMETVEYCADLAHRHGVCVLLDPSPAKPLSQNLMQNINYLVMNEVEAAALTKEGNFYKEDELQAAADQLHQQGAPGVVITLGKRGAYYSVGDQRGRLPAFEVDTVDSTAAGDAFVGALSVALGSQRQVPDAMRFASAAAGLATSKKGARPSLPYLVEVEDLLGIRRADQSVSSAPEDTLG